MIVDLEAGGAERALTNLVVSSNKEEFVHRVICLSHGGFYEDMIRDSNIELKSIGGEGISALPGWLYKLSSELRSFEPDIVQGWMYYPNLIALTTLRFLIPFGHSKILWGIRCSDMNSQFYPKNLKRVIRLGKIMSWLPDSIVVNSHAGLYYHERLGYRNNNFCVIENGFDYRHFKPDPLARLKMRNQLGLKPEDFAVGVVARLDPMKGYDIALKACAQCPEMFFFAAGSNTDKLLGPKNFRGLGRREDIHLLYNAFDVVVSASIFGEGMSNSIGEAMASKIPVIATDVGDSKKMLIGDDNVAHGGLVVEKENVKAIVDALNRLRADIDWRQRLGGEGRRRIIEKYSLDTCKEKYALLYRKLVEQ